MGRRDKEGVGGHTEEELAASKQSALTGILAEEDHLLQGDCWANR